MKIKQNIKSSSFSFERMHGNELKEGLEGSQFQYGKWQKVTKKSWKTQEIVNWKLSGIPASDDSKTQIQLFVQILEY